MFTAIALITVFATMTAGLEHREGAVLFIGSGLPPGPLPAQPSPPGRACLVCHRWPATKQDAASYPTSPAPSSDSAAAHSENRSAEHPSELQSLMPISYAAFCLT